MTRAALGAVGAHPATLEVAPMTWLTWRQFRGQARSPLAALAAARDRPGDPRSDRPARRYGAGTRPPAERSGDEYFNCLLVTGS